MHHYFCIFVRVSNNQQILKGQRIDNATFSVIQKSYGWHSNGKAGTKGQEQSKSSLNTSSILVFNSDSRSETHANNSGNKNKMTSSSLVQSRESLVSTVGSVQTDSKSWFGLVPACLQACMAFSVGENIIILLSTAISII